MSERVQLSRRAGWRKPEGAIVVARPTRWGNPFRIDLFGRERSIALFANTVRGIWSPDLIDDSEPNALLGAAWRAHEDWLQRLGAPPIELAPYELRGHDLACWCPLDQPCHADVLLEIAA